MRLKAGIVAALCCVFALCVSLVGCGGGVDKSLYTGTWVMQSSNDETFDADTIELMKSLNVQVTLTLDEEGGGSLNILGNDPHDVTWEATSNTEGTATVDGSTAKLVLEGETLTLEDGAGMTMTFARSSSSAASEASSSSAASTASASASAAAADAESGAAADAGEAAAAETGNTSEAAEGDAADAADGGEA